MSWYKKRDTCQSIMANGISLINCGTVTRPLKLKTTTTTTLPVESQTTLYITMIMILPKTNFILWKTRMEKRINDIWTIGQSRD
jgi:hypothetical protein